ncbi:MAG: hypothetical protein WCH83_02905 [Alphaproteobacteria bacterium]|jgi:hypothetical protein
MPPLIIAAGITAAAFAAMRYLLKPLFEAEPEPEPVRAEAPPVRTLRRDPVTGEYRPL